eukprot:1160894-Pelagomonas_calceolata.AAC.25
MSGATQIARFCEAKPRDQKNGHRSRKNSESSMRKEREKAGVKDAAQLANNIHPFKAIQANPSKFQCRTAADRLPKGISWTPSLLRRSHIELEVDDVTCEKGGKGSNGMIKGT